MLRLKTMQVTMLNNFMIQSFCTIAIRYKLGNIKIHKNTVEILQSTENYKLFVIFYQICDKYTCTDQTIVLLYLQHYLF